MAKISGWPGTLKSGFTFTRPAWSSSTPSFWVSGVAETPAAQMMFPARMISPLASSTSPSRILFTGVAVRTFTPRCFELTLGAGGKFRRIVGQHAWRAFEQKNHGLRGINPPEIALQYRPRQFGERAGQFQPGRPAAHHDDGQQPLTHGGVRFIFRLFEREQDAAPDAQRIIERFQAGREGFPLRMAEITGQAAGREDKVVVVQGAFFEQNFFIAEVKAGGLMEQHRDIGPVGQNGADGLRDFRCGQPAGGNLVEQGLEQMMIRAIDDRYHGVGAIEFFAKGQPAKTRPKHDHTNRLFFIAVHAPNFDELVEIAMRRRKNCRHLSGRLPVQLELNFFSSGGSNYTVAG